MPVDVSGLSFVNIDFLSSPSVFLNNLKPGDDGSISVPIEYYLLPFYFCLFLSHRIVGIWEQEVIFASLFLMIMTLLWFLLEER